MKNLLLTTLTMLVLSFEASSQIENVWFNDELNFEKIYAGFDSWMVVPNDSLVAIPFAALRLGTALTWNLSKSFSFYSHGALQWSSSNQTFAIAAFVLNVKLTNRLQLGVGLPPTATTFTRAHPITWKNQSESYAQSRIPGNQPGVLLLYSFSQKLNVAYSFQYIGSSTWSNHLNITYGPLGIAGFIREDKNFFLSLRFNNEKIDANYNYSSLLQEHSSSVFYNFIKEYEIYADANYLAKLEESKVASFGVRRYFPDNRYHTGGFIAVYYEIVNKQTLFQLFLHLK